MSLLSAETAPLRPKSNSATSDGRHERVGDQIELLESDRGLAAAWGHSSLAIQFERKNTRRRETAHLLEERELAPRGKPAALNQRKEGDSTRRAPSISLAQQERGSMIKP